MGRKTRVWFISLSVDNKSTRLNVRTIHVKLEASPNRPSRAQTPGYSAGQVAKRDLFGGPFDDLAALEVSSSALTTTRQRNPGNRNLHHLPPGSSICPANFWRSRAHKAGRRPGDERRGGKMPDGDDPAPEGGPGPPPRWSEVEDGILKEAVARHGVCRWSEVAKLIWTKDAGDADAAPGQREGEPGCRLGERVAPGPPATGRIFPAPVCGASPPPTATGAGAGIWSYLAPHPLMPGRARG
ncbi:hypothetical protein GGS23DRAFT_350740 [Durotheca rogersii]|uniref:uncharacterized protein n=1 Tax=Durotheca rogersii TaxID=419775 RepID=UPI00222125A6|nr:uncharacterized protein GGS23DRAFT_350740 [Durotheca rogersii]KAI5865691.1 hypothetical protein GGS23DRAFT_350740 [Durotheca rogersii]